MSISHIASVAAYGSRIGAATCWRTSRFVRDDGRGDRIHISNSANVASNSGLSNARKL